MPLPLDNAAVVLQVIIELLPDIDNDTIKTALADVKLPGRFQQLDGHTILDVAHNPHAAEYLVDRVRKEFPERNIRLVIAMLKDKDIALVLSTLSTLDPIWYIASLDIDRSADSKVLYNHLLTQGDVRATQWESIEAAYEQAETDLENNDIIVVTGSFFTVSAVLELLENRGS